VLPGWRAAEARERQVRRAEPILDPATALNLSEELCELDPDLFREEDSVRKREVGETRAAWAKLRERLGWQCPQTGFETLLNSMNAGKGGRVLVTLVA